MSQVNVCSCPEPAAKRLDEPMHTHKNCAVYHTGASCALRGGAMAKDNGQDKDGFENVEGNVTAKSTLLGLRVKSVQLTEGKEAGEADVAATLVGLGSQYAQEVFDIALAREEIQIRTAGDGRKAEGALRRVVIDIPPGEKPIRVRAQVEGGRDLVDMALKQVRLERRQGTLPLRPKGGKPTKKRRAGRPDARA